MTRLAAAILLACPLGQACSPLVFELVPHDDTGEATTAPDDPTHEPPDNPYPDSAGSSCHDGAPGPGETDIDCGGPCPPCKPGSPCQSPDDCEDGECFAGTCSAPQCHDISDCPLVGPCELPSCLPTGVCQPSPREDGEPCDDGDGCTLDETCQSGTCSAGLHTDCSGLEGPCRAAVCNPVTGNCGVEWRLEGEPCEDGDKCTVGEQCSAGECVPPQPKPPILLTDFSLAGEWIAEPPWQIGPAVPSRCAIPKADDPGQDHSPSADNHLAGAAIGACLPTDPFPEACLTSPAVDLSGVPGEVWLTFFDIFSNSGAGMQSRVDVFDPFKGGWIPLITITQPLVAPDWLEHAEDLSPFKSPELRVRFCQRADGPGPPVGGWSIDDLAIGPPTCPF